MPHPKLLLQLEKGGEHPFITNSYQTSLKNCLQNISVYVLYVVSPCLLMSLVKKNPNGSYEKMSDHLSDEINPKAEARKQGKEAGFLPAP